MHLNYIVHLYEEHLEVSLGLIHRIDSETLGLVKKAAEMCTTIPHLIVDSEKYIIVSKDTIVLPTNHEHISVQIDLIEDLVPA